MLGFHSSFRLHGLSFLILLLFSLPLFADDAIPTQLDEWKGWVLKDQQNSDCTPSSLNHKKRLCAWPETLSLTIHSHGLDFQQTWRIDQKTEIMLPGDKRYWPQQMKVNGTPSHAEETTEHAYPILTLGSGLQTIEGKILWQEQPSRLHIPVQTSKINLVIQGIAVNSPQIDDDHYLLLTQNTFNNVIENNNQSVSVFRHYHDSIPSQLTTTIRLNVSGEQRHYQLPLSMPRGFTISGLDSLLDARLQNDNLNIEVKPGQWEIQLISHRFEPESGFSIPAASGDWPKQEVWSIQATNTFRSFELDPATEIAPNQTDMPEQWKNLPAITVTENTDIALKTQQRGFNQYESNQITLERDIWLNFDGKGYALRDQLKGHIEQQWRLESTPPLILGSALLDNENQVITQKTGQNVGIELRQGGLNLIAESRIEGLKDTLYISGWNQALDKASWRLHLPPGWDIFHISGAEKTSHGWVQQWQLTDLFFVFFAVIACYRLSGIKLAALTLLSLGLFWHTQSAPQWIWLVLIASYALIKITSGQIRQYCWLFSLLVLTVITLQALPYTVQQVRLTLYPQLALDQMFSPSWAYYHGEQWPERKDNQNDTAEIPELQVSSAKEPLKEDRAAQTGSGTPNWQGNIVYLTWDSPVSETDQIQIIYTSPNITRFLQIIRATFLFALIATFGNLLFQAKVTYQSKNDKKHTANTNHSVSVILIALIGLSHFNPAQATDTWPSDALLKEYKKHLLKASDCFPRCASIESLRVSENRHLLTLNWQIGVSEDVAVPLLSGSIPPIHSLNDKTGHPLARLKDQEGTLWTKLSSGLHVVSLVLNIENSNQWLLKSVLNPHNITIDPTDSWDINTVSNHKIQGQRKVNISSKNALIGQKTFPAKARIERILSLGKTWEVTSKVSRIEQKNTSDLIIALPLLPNEKPLGQHRLDGDKIMINLSAEETSTSWQSTLPIQDTLTLAVPSESHWAETWLLKASTDWHIQQTSGIPLYKQTNENNQWEPMWRPWPGEKVVLSIQNPPAQAGKTLTIQSSHWKLSPGKNISKGRLYLELNSSKGSVLPIKIPEGAQIEGLRLNNKTRQANLNGQSVDINIPPGQHSVTLELIFDTGMTEQYRSASITLPEASINHSIHVKLPNDRWLLFTRGPLVGPAVLIWGVFLVVTCLAIIMGRMKELPLNTGSWFLLFIGFTQTTPLLTVMMIGWFLSFYAKKRWLSHLNTAKKFNTIQVLLALFSLISLFFLAISIWSSLLEQPYMAIQGNGSSHYNLHWFTDKIPTTTPTIELFSLPIMYYRVVMLCWALWLAFSLVNWLRWIWQHVNLNGEIWRDNPKPSPIPADNKPSNDGKKAQ